MEEAGFEGIRVYITRRQKTVVQYIATQPIMELCERSVWRPGDWVSWRWWEQEVLCLEGSTDRLVKELDGEEDKCGEREAQEETPGQD